MHRWSLTLLLTLATPVLAQEAEEAPAVSPPAAEPAPATGQAASAEEPAPAADKPARRRRASQQATAEVPAPAAQAPAPQAPAPEPGSVQEEVRDEARYLLSYLLTGDVRGAVPMLAFPFQLEERRFDTPESLVVAWVKEIRNKRTDLVTLYDIEVLSYAEMEKKYGKPPARLGAIIPRGTEVYAAVANLSGRAAVLLYRKAGTEWLAFAYTD